jgi:hypothetical protein
MEEPVAVAGGAVVMRLRAVATVVVRAAVIGMTVTCVPVAPLIVTLSGPPVQVASVVLLVVSVGVVRLACHFSPSISHSGLPTVGASGCRARAAICRLKAR